MSARPGHALVPHTADMGIEAWAEKRRELFVEAALGLKQMLFGETPIASVREQPVRLEAGDQAELLVAWLNEILYQLETGGLAPAAFRIERLETRHLDAVICGETYDATRHVEDRQAKAVTYHQVTLERRPNGWYARVYVDL